MKPNISRALKIKGWMQSDELRWLARACHKCERICEVGVYRGRTTRCFLDNSDAIIWCVDHWQYKPGDWTAFRKAVGKDWGRVTPVRRDSETAAAILLNNHGPGFFDIVFIDAGHDYKSVRKDIILYRPLVRPGGVLCGHDYAAKAWKGVVRAVNELVPDRRVAGVIWWTKV